MNDLNDLLGRTVGDPPRPLDTDALLATAGRRRVFARTGAGIMTAGLVVAALVTLPPLLSPARTATPAARTSVQSTVPTGSQLPSPYPCPTPSPLPPGMAIDWAAILIWEGREFSPVPDPPAVQLGEALGSIRCEISEISGDGSMPVPGPWPDGTSTFYPVGTPVRSIVGADPHCFVAVVEPSNSSTVVWASRASGCPALSTPIPSGTASP